MPQEKIGKFIYDLFYSSIINKKITVKPHRKVINDEDNGVWKRGCGKSTIAALLAKAMANRGYRVLVIDSDESNFGLHRQLPNSQ